MPNGRGEIDCATVIWFIGTTHRELNSIIEKTPILDRSLLITWYDLPANGRTAYLAWLHTYHLPALAKRPGVLWAAHYEVQKYDIPARVRHTTDPAVPNGNDYVLIVGAASSHDFSKPLDAFVKPGGAEDAGLTSEDRKMLALRTGERLSIMTEEARIDGPEIATRANGGAPAPCIQLGSFNGNDQSAEDELLAWYARWRMPALGKLPGCVALRKMVSVSGWARHGVMYEFTSLTAREAGMKQMGALYPEMTAWTERFIPHLTHAPGSPHIGVRLWPPVQD